MSSSLMIALISHGLVQFKNSGVLVKWTSAILHKLSLFSITAGVDYQKLYIRC